MNIDFLNNLNDTVRHNLILLRCDCNSMEETIKRLTDNGVAVINIGKELSKKLKTLESSKLLTIETQEYLHQLIEAKAADGATGKPKAVAIYNIAILLEPSLSLNVSKLLKDLSKDVKIIILWDNLYCHGMLHWGIEQGQYHVDLSDFYIAEESANYEV